MTEYFLERPDSRLEATEEQVCIIEAVLNTKDNIIINALAGAAKSTTLEFICKYLTGIPILSLAFNKRIAEELGSRLPSHVQCKTLNALGHRVWMTALGSTKIVLNTKKTKELIDEWADENLHKSEREEFYDVYGSLLRAVDSTKLKGYVPAAFHANSKPVYTELSDEWFEDLFDGTPPRWLPALIDSVLTKSIRLAYKGSIDFNDQIYMPTLFGGTFPAFPVVMVDEAQDLSPLNHAMLRKLVRQRLIAVGDPWQSIYGFRGAVTNGMSVLKSTFSMTEFNLSVSFRCPRAVVRKANARVPHMRFPDWAIEGEVRSLSSWNASAIPDGAAIICRNNAPLFACALALIRAGRGVKLLGADIGPSLIKTLKKLGPPDLPRDQLLTEIEKWKSAKLAKARSAGTIEDKAECLRIFAEAGETLSQAVTWAEHLFAMGGTIQLMSGHKSKGLEFETVYHLDPWRVPSKWAQNSQETLDQELNLLYVITTRTKKNLYLVNLDDFNG